MYLDIKFFKSQHANGRTRVPMHADRAFSTRFNQSLQVKGKVDAKGNLYAQIKGYVWITPSKKDHQQAVIRKT